ncbi:hypothetical protein BJ165DRAFT_1522347 [Panaeolus papilionaceus]|nr:hypothetical protein BJ165DRAFT_1522347 [Panaeolus papilionaceus]
MTTSSQSLSSNSSSSERDYTPQNWHQASLAIEAAYSRISQVRQDLMRLSNAMPNALPIPAVHRDVDPGHDALLLSAAETRETNATPTSTTATADYYESFNPYLPRASRRFESEFSSNHTSDNSESAGSQTSPTNRPSPSSHSSPILNVLPPQRHLSSNSPIHNAASTTRGRQVASRDYALRRDAERFSYHLENSLNILLSNPNSGDLSNTNTMPPQPNTEMTFHDVAPPLPRPTSPSHPHSAPDDLLEQRWRIFSAGLQARRFGQAVTLSPDSILQRNFALATSNWQAQDASSSQEFENYSNWRDQDFPLWLPNEGREWEFANQSGHPSSESNYTRREPARLLQRNNNSESRPFNVAPRRTDPPRRGWARLDSDGLEIPQNEEDELERTRTEYRMRALQHAREERTTATYVDTPGGGYRAPVIYGSVMDAALRVQNTRQRQPSTYEKQDDCHPHVPFYVDPLPMPLASMEINPARVDNLYVDIVVPRRAIFAGR